tara:strand:- start:3677 stop:3988 length:312 start_codon:yes stop_codon:yes gene_type:complete
MRTGSKCIETVCIGAPWVGNHTAGPAFALAFGGGKGGNPSAHGSNHGLAVFWPGRGAGLIRQTARPSCGPQGRSAGNIEEPPGAGKRRICEQMKIGKKNDATS